MMLCVTMFWIFLINCVTAVRDPGDLASVLRTEGDRIVSSLGDLSRRCDKSEDNLEILTAVHTSLDLQRRVTQLEEQISNLEYLLSDLLPGKSRRDISVVPSSAVFFSALRSEILQCRGCPVSYTKVNTNTGAGMNINSGVFTSPVNGSFYFQFHGLVGQGHEARVVMMLNDDVVATMYDKDYSGNNNRYAMFGQSVILDMKGLDNVHFYWNYYNCSGR